MLVYLGYRVPSQDEINILITGIDIDLRGVIRESDYLKVLRRFREVEISNQRKIFKATDQDHSGEVSVEELKHLLNLLNVYPTPDLMAEIMQEIDQDNSGDFDFSEFVSLLNHIRRSEGFPKQDIEEFRLAHTELLNSETGEMDTSLLAQALRRLGFNPRPGIAHQVIEEVDVDNSCGLDFKELKKKLKNISGT